MPSDYPKDPAEYDGDDGEDDEEGEEDEEEEVVPKSWTELIPLEELEELEDGPSTFFVGGFSVCTRLSAAVARARYTQDRILVFPGTYTEALPPLAPGLEGKFEPGSPQDTLVLDEARLAGLRIEGVPYAVATSAYFAERDRTTAAGASAAAAADTGKAARTAARALIAEREPTTGRRVGPWFIYALAAEQQLARAAAAAEAAAAGTATTSMGSTLYAARVTPTCGDESVHPVISSRLVIRTSAAGVVGEEAAAPSPLRVYVPTADTFRDDDDEEEEEEDGGGGEDGQADDRRAGRDERGSDGDGDDDASSTRRAPPAPTGVRVRGLCFTGGAALEPLTAAQLSHCVLGAPSAVCKDGSAAPQPIVRPASMVTAHPLSEAVLTRCLVYGGVRHGLYAYPRSAVVLRSCLVEGPSPTAVAVAVTARGRAQRHAPSALAQLAAKAHARELAASGSGGAAAGTGALGVDAEGGSVAFVVPPPGGTVCDVAVLCDDADVSMTDCMLSNTRLGLVLHAGCEGTRITACDIRCTEEAGIYAYGMAGAASLVQSCVRRCGRECLLLVGPTESQVEQREAEDGAAHHHLNEAGDDEAGDDEDAEATGQVARRPVFAQHPRIRGCTFVGTVRAQGLVRVGACTDNLLFAPRQADLGAADGDEAAVLAGLIQGPSYGVSKTFPMRGFTVAGREGVPRKAAAAEEGDG